MFLEDQDVSNRLNSDRNLANRFGSGADRVSPVSPKGHQETSESGASSNELTDERANEGTNEGINESSADQVTDEQITKVNEIILHRPGNNRKHIHPKVRETIAILARTGESQTKIAEEFGVSDYEVHALKEGKITRGMDKELVEKKLEEVRDLAITKMMMSMGLITEEKLSKAKATDLSNIAANMSRVVEKSLPKQVSVGSGLSITIYAPEQRKESYYDAVEI